MTLHLYHCPGSLQHVSHPLCSIVLSLAFVAADLVQDMKFINQFGVLKITV